MTNTNVFALSALGLDTFLFAEVGCEPNGSSLTVLSVLARLGRDPWAQAALWMKLPKGEATEQLSQIIQQLPLCKEALAEAPATAARLILLLPNKSDLVPRRRNVLRPIVLPTQLRKYFLFRSCAQVLNRVLLYFKQ